MISEAMQAIFWDDFIRRDETALMELGDEVERAMFWELGGFIEGVTA